MTERIAYNEYAKLKYNTIITMKLFPSVQDSTRPQISLYNMRTIKLHCAKCVVLLISSLLCRLRLRNYKIWTDCINYAQCVTVWQGFKSNHQYRTYDE